MREKKKIQRVHFVGIGGIGMSALARYYRAQGWRVTGSDAAESAITRALRKEGIRVFENHAARHLIPTTARVIVSLAVEAKNPELRRARTLHIPVLSYAEAVGELTQRYNTIAISGSHGKSTTTALLGLILTRAGLDPTVIVGTNLREFKGINFRAGKSKYLVLEADEWGKSFHHYTPHIAVITNVDKEHLDVYGTYQGVIRGFARYLKNVRPGGTIVANGGSEGVRMAITKSKIQPARRSLGAGGNPKLSVNVVWYNHARFSRHLLAIPGRHNQENAEAAWQAWNIIARSEHISPTRAKKIAREVFKNYHGSWRRFEKLQIANRPASTSRGEAGKSQIAQAVLYTDYAHHPTEIRATLAGAREAYPKKKIVCVFEPHQADRLKRLFKEFKTAFDVADETIILPVYRVLGREERADEKTSHDLVNAIRQETVRYAQNFKQAIALLKSDLQNSTTVVIFMSAGNLDAEVRAYFCAK